MPPRKKAAKKEEVEEEEETSTIFEDITFAFVGKLSQTQKALTTLAEDNGATVARSVTKKVTHIVTTQQDVDDGKVSPSDSVKVVSEDFLHESIKKGKKLAEKDYELTKATKRKAEEAEQESEEEEKTTKKAKTETKGKGKGKGKSKKNEKEEESEEEVEEKQIVKVVKKGKAAVDSHCSLKNSHHVLEQSGEVYDAMLNQTDIDYGVKGHNKFYVIQALEADGGGSYYVWTRWGRVGAAGQNKLEPCGSAAAAIKGFEKKFKDKSGNNWANRKSFKPVSGKYDLIEMDYGNDDDEDDLQEKLEKKRANRGETSSSKLDARVQELVKLIFDLKMFESTLVEFDIDVKKMPLGKISKNQIQKGYEILEEIEEELKKKSPSRSTLSSLCSRFYTVIPHNFGMQLPPVITDLESLQKKMDLLEVLGDMEIAQTMLKEEKKADELNPIDVKYKMLLNNIDPVDKKSDEWNRIETYLHNTMEGYKLTLLDVYKVDRQGEEERFKEFKDIKERKLLWHGSKVAVFASILSGGLRIMPHSGGRVGRGLYFADIVAKSASYCGLHNNIGLILLNEVALGKSHEITRDDPSLVKAPAGHQSVLARGIKMPDKDNDYVDTDLSSTGHPVVIPQGKIKNLPVSSSFAHNEYLVYDAGQVHMKYLLMLRWGR